MWERIFHKWLRIPYTLSVHRTRAQGKPRATLLFIHGIGNSAASWQKVIDKLPDDVEVLAVDLLGFGSSLKPDWVRYDADLQAKSIMATIAKQRIAKKLIVVGHSLGAIVAIELARKYPLVVRQLILCSPPIYKPSNVRQGMKMINSDHILRKVFKTITNYPDYFMKLSRLAIKYRLLNPDIQLTQDNIAAYTATLDAAIINQTAYQDLEEVSVPTKIIYGLFDVFVVTKNLKLITRRNTRISLIKAPHGHELRGRYVTTLVRELKRELNV